MTRILIVDDDYESRQIICSIIRESKYNYLSIFEAENAEKGLDMLKQKRPLVMFVDLSLPDQDGLSFGKQALKLYPQLNIIVVTQLKMFQTVQDSINAGFSAYYLKPITKSDVLSALERFMTDGLVNETNTFMKKDDSLANFTPDLGNPIQTALNYIQLKYHEPLTLKEVSEFVYLSPTYFSRLFKEETNTTFIEYLNQYRIEKSKNLLKMTSLPVEVIAHHIGFSSASYFATTFKKNVGKTPSEYRQLFSNFGS